MSIDFPFSGASIESEMKQFAKDLLRVQGDLDRLKNAVSHFAVWVIQQLQNLVNQVLNRAVTEATRSIPIIGPILGIRMDVALSFLNAFFTGSMSGWF